MKGIKISHDEKETVIAALREHGTMQYASKICGVSIRTLNEEMRRSEVFKRRVLEARAIGYNKIADDARQLVIDYMSGNLAEKCPACHAEEQTPKCKLCDGKGIILTKTDRNRLTAAIALLNAYEPGFRGVTTITGRVDHDIRVITAVPRPNYDAIEAPKVKILPKPQKQLQKSSENASPTP